MTATNLSAILTRAARRSLRIIPDSEVVELRKVLSAARCIRHWHCSGDDGMIVSKPHVFALWDAIDAYDKAVGVHEP